MRYFDLRLSPETEGLHPVDRGLAATGGLEREALLHIDAFPDGTGVMLYRLRGDPEVARSFAESSEHVLSYDIVDTGEDDTVHLYLHVPPGEPAGTLIELCYEYALIIDTPLEFTGGDEVRITVVGRHEMLREALKDLPDDFRVSVDQVGTYQPGDHDLLSLLTPRQREVFETAVDLGYYEIPREMNQEELAEELDCAPSTVDEHLRKAESKILSAAVRRPSGQ